MEKARAKGGEITADKERREGQENTITADTTQRWRRSYSAACAAICNNEAVVEVESSAINGVSSAMPIPTRDPQSITAWEEVQGCEGGGLF